MADPSRPAVIVGTVDMIGSRLLFEGYGCGFKSRPLHAGFLGQDVLLVHDEAHLEPAFQELLERIEEQQSTHERTGEVPWSKLRIMSLTATPRGDRKPFELTPDEQDTPETLSEPPTLPIHHVWRRLKAKKGISFIGVPRSEIAASIARQALRHKESGKAILVFVRTLDDLNAVRSALIKNGSGLAEEQVAILTGTIRGRERDRLATDNVVFARFLAESKVAPIEGTVYLVCTSAGEVGVDISADHMVSDLTPLDSMAQRFGRVNRRGGGAAEIDVVYESDPDPKRSADRITTLGELTEKDKKGKGFAVPLGGRTVVLPPTAGGLNDSGMLDGSAAFNMKPRGDYDLAGYVPVREATKGSGPNNGFTFLRLLQSVRADGQVDFRVVGSTFGLDERFTFDPEEDEAGTERQFLITKFQEAGLPRLKLAIEITIRESDEESADQNSSSVTEGARDTGFGGAVTFLVFKKVGERPKLKGAAAWPSLDQHLDGVRKFAESLCDQLGFPSDLAKAVSFAAFCHDLGKDRGVWQRGAGNNRGHLSVAKTLHGRAPENLNGFRHEFASLIDVQSYPELMKEFEAFSPELQDVILHLIAAHHGRGRPHFPGRGDADLWRQTAKKQSRRRSPRPENIDPERPDAASNWVAAAVPSRFARLQRKYGRWGLAYLESLIRAADALDSQRIEDSPIGESVSGAWPKSPPTFSWPQIEKASDAAIRIRMEPTNPGQFFACCGLHELAHRLWQGAEGWFDGPDFCLRPVDSSGSEQATSRHLLHDLAHCQVTNVMRPAQLALLEELSRMKSKDRTEDQENHKKALESLRRESPIRLCFQGRFDLRIDWFLDERASGNRFKTWAGQQTVIDIAQGMHRPLSQFDTSEIPPAEWLSRSVPVDALPFYFDSGLSGQGSALDAGFSFDPLGFKMPSRPLLELAAFIGLQRFRPLQVPDENLYRFDLWPRPLLPATAAAAVCGAAAATGARRYEFRLLYRTKYLKSFLPAQPSRGDAR